MKSVGRDDERMMECMVTNLANVKTDMKPGRNVVVFVVVVYIIVVNVAPLIYLAGELLIVIGVF